MTLKTIPVEPDLLDVSVLKKPKPRTPRTTTPFDPWHSRPDTRSPEERLRQYNQVVQEWYAKHPHQNWTKASITEHILEFTPQEQKAFFKLFAIQEVTTEEPTTTEASSTTVASQQSNDLQHAESQGEPTTNPGAPAVNTEAPAEATSPTAATEVSTPTAEDTAPAAEETPAAEAEAEPAAEPEAAAAEPEATAEPESNAADPEAAVQTITAKPLKPVTLDPPVTVKKLVVVVNEPETIEVVKTTKKPKTAKPVKTTKKPVKTTKKPVNRKTSIKPLVSVATTTVATEMGTRQSSPKVLPGATLEQDLSSGWRLLDVHLPSAMGTMFICVLVVIFVAILLRCCLKNWISYRRIRHQREVEVSLRELRRSNNENQLSSLINSSNSGMPIQPIVRSQPRIALPLDVA